MNAILPFAELAAPPGAALIAWPDGIVDPNAYAVREIAAPCSLAEALALTSLDLTRPVLVRMMRPGGPPLFYARAEWAAAVVTPGARIAAMDLPQGKGGSRIFAILAVIVAAAILGPEVAVLLGFSEAGTAAAIATSVIGMAGTALVNALLPPPAPGALKQEQASPTYSLNAQGNYARLGQAVEEQFGRHIHYPSLLTAYKEFPGDDEYLYLALGLGEGEFEILEWGWAGTPAWRAEPYLDINGGTNRGDPSHNRLLGRFPLWRPLSRGWFLRAIGERLAQALGTDAIDGHRMSAAAEAAASLYGQHEPPIAVDQFLDHLRAEMAKIGAFRDSDAQQSLWGQK